LKSHHITNRDSWSQNSLQQEHPRLPSAPPTCQGLTFSGHQRNILQWCVRGTVQAQTRMQQSAHGLCPSMSYLTPDRIPPHLPSSLWWSRTTSI
jgi:hypothetical protein